MPKIKTRFRYNRLLDKFKPMRFLLFLKVFLITFAVQSSEFPINSKITYGKLKNGLTYYIRPNQKPEQKAEIRLYVKAGSIHERDDQQGQPHNKIVANISITISYLNTFNIANLFFLN